MADKKFKGSDGRMYSALELQAMLTETWSNNACLGYVVKVMENLKYPFEDIKRVVQEMAVEFDWTSLKEAETYYNKSRY